MSSAWNRINLASIDHRVPLGPACYAIYADGELVYIGQTHNLRKRLDAHGCVVARYSNSFATAWGIFRGVVVKYRRIDRHGDWAMHELRLIRRLRPRGNRVGCRGRKSAQ